jgi:ABC-2 type transport system ATP-binding protein
MTTAIEQALELSARPVERDSMVLVDGLVKRYPGRPVNAVDGVSFAVARGEVFGLLGPNGAGKTTTIGAMTTRVVPTEGRVLIAGVDVALDPVAAKRRFGVVPQRPNLDRSLTARQNLTFHGAYFGFSKRRREEVADRLLEEFGLAERANDKTDKFSGGMAQRLLIARALMHEPELVFLDEPGTGLDPQSRLFVHERIAELHAHGVTVLVTTHDMHEAEKLCERIAIVDRGKLLALGTPDELRRRVPASSALELDIAFPANGDFDGLLEHLGRLPDVERVEPVEAEERRRVRLYGGDTDLIPAALDAVAARRGEVVDLRLARASLEDVFIHLTGRGLR